MCAINCEDCEDKDTCQLRPVQEYQISSDIVITVEPIRNPIDRAMGYGKVKIGKSKTK